MWRIGSLIGADSIVGEVRGRGAMLALEFVKPGTREPAPETARQVASQCHSEGVLMLVCGTYGNVVRLLPPLVISQELLSDGLDVLVRAIKAAS
jgi:4-aminobutyrate aminotransferase / (S)-3-amino-2-methylpropionate transaminase / 5-aminovalerate transaminase